LSVFFDDYPLFYETSETASSATRLNLRHQAMIEANRDILEGARVLDLASHDGRWSFAALKAGAAHVIGLEARRQLVDNANKTFAEYGVPTDRFQFIQGDMFRVLSQRDFDVDVVMCLGFIYHTLRYGELFRGILDAKPEHCILDTKVILGDEPLVRLNVNRTGVQSNAARDQVSHGRRAVAGWPTVNALKLILDVYDFDVEEQYDWPALLESRPDALRAAGDYNTGNRVTMRCRSRQPQPTPGPAAEDQEAEAAEQTSVQPS
jgi:Methyltransferase domain